MPYCASHNMPDFQFYLGKLSSVLNNSDTPYVYAIGDFNANINTMSNCNNHAFGDE